MDADYSGEFTMLISGNCNTNVAFKSFEDSDMTERTPLDEAVYRRMKTVEELYGVGGELRRVTADRLATAGREISASLVVGAG